MLRFRRLAVLMNQACHLITSSTPFFVGGGGPPLSSIKGLKMVSESYTVRATSTREILNIPGVRT